MYRKLLDIDYVGKDGKKRKYTRTYCSFVRQLKKFNVKDDNVNKVTIRPTRYQKLVASYPGEYVEIDLKYVPEGCLNFERNCRYYQITAIDLYTRKRVLKIIKEASTYELAKFALTMEKAFGFKIKVVQTDNGAEFVNNSVNSDKKTAFQKALKFLGIEHKRTRPYSPWQNGVVERSHREDGKRFYSRTFNSEKELIKANKRYETTYNNTYRKVLNFKSPEEILKSYKLQSSGVIIN